MERDARKKRTMALLSRMRLHGMFKDQKKVQRPSSSNWLWEDNAMGLRATFIAMVLLVMRLFSSTEAAWQGSATVASGSWGSADNQFGIEYGDTNCGNFATTCY